MARNNRTRRNTQNNYYGGRETYDFSSRRLPLSHKKQVPLSSFEDRRRFHPEGSGRPAKTFRAISARFKVGGITLAKARRPEGSVWDARSQGYEPLPFKIGFVEPSRVLVCVRRKIRREVIHALGINKLRGLGRGGVRFNENSKFSC